MLEKGNLQADPEFEPLEWQVWKRTELVALVLAWLILVLPATFTVMMSLARPLARPNPTSSRVTCISEQSGINFFVILETNPFILRIKKQNYPGLDTLNCESHCLNE